MNEKERCRATDKAEYTRVWLTSQLANQIFLWISRYALVWLARLGAAGYIPRMAKRERTEAQLEAERRYRENRAQVLLRFTPAEMAEIKKASGSDKAAEWIKARALAAAKRAR